MARIVPIKNDDLRSLIALEGRPVNLSVGLEGDGTALENDPPTSPPVYDDIVTGVIDIDVGRAMMVNSITITSNAKGRVSGVIAQNAIGDWIGLSNQDEFSLAVSDGGSSTLNFDGLVLGSGSRVSLTFTPYPETGQTDPDIGMHINGIEFTADFNFNANKKLLYCGDSISWSLMGNWKTQDMGYNYSGNRKEGSNPYPDYFGDELAAFRLVNALRSQTNPESIRLVNKGFGGSKLATDQWFASRSGMYTIDWNMMVMQAGVNDATDVQTPLRQLTMGQRIQDMVEKRNEDGRAEYPMVFCTPPIADDRYDGTDARVCLDQRVPISSESYTGSFDSTTGTEISFGATPSGDRWYEVKGDGSNDLEMKGGVADEVYRLDFTTQNDLLTGVAAGSNTKAFIRTLESQQNVDDSPPPSDGILTIDANTTMFVRCVTRDEEYEEVDRVSLIGRALSADAQYFDASESTIDHFITGVNTSATEILAPTIAGVSESVPIVNAFPSRNITQFNFGPTSTLRTENTNLPPASVIDESDVWVRVTGMQDTAGAGEISWADVNGFYKVINYTISPDGQRITNIQVILDTRDSANRKFNGNYDTVTKGTLELFSSRPYLVEFEGSSANTLEANNYSYFAHGDNTVDDYKVKVQLSTGTGTQFNLVAGKGIVFSVYQQGNVIYMNEVVSGDITNAGKIVGSDTLDNFFSQTETGLTRLKTVRKVITDTVNSYDSSANVHLVDLYDVDDLKTTTETTAGRLIYGSDNYKADTSGGASSKLMVNDLIEDPLFKATGDSGVNERVMGKRLHRSPKGHEEIYNRLYSVISSTTIPN